MLKSLYFYRNNPLHFHILVSRTSQKVLHTLFETWAIPQVNVSFYDIAEHMYDINWIPNSHYSGIYGLLKLMFPKILPEHVTKVIVLDTDLTFKSDISELWKLFEDFSIDQRVVETFDALQQLMLNDTVNVDIQTKMFFNGLISVMYHRYHEVIGRPRSARTPQVEEAVLQVLEDNPNVSIRDIGRYLNVLGLVENQSDYYLSKTTMRWPAIGRGFNTGVILYHLERLRNLNWVEVWTKIGKKTAILHGATSLADQDIINAVCKQNPHFLYEVPCNWNIQLSYHTLSHNCYVNNEVKIIHWNSPKKVNVVNRDGNYFRSMYSTFLELNGNLLRRQLYDCTSTVKNIENAHANVCSEFQKAQASKWTTLLFFKKFEYDPTINDVTFLAQFSYDRLQLVEELCRYWDGPISLTLYATDLEFQQALTYVDNTEVLRDRTNIAFHVVFKNGEYHPINILRNIGLQNVNTPYVFLADIDFLPMSGLYSELKKYINSISNMDKKALIVPAFETQRYKSALPKSKTELLQKLEHKSIFTFRYDVWASGHAPTNYTRWKTAKLPYNVKWQPDYEPYVVVQSNVTQYDPRFMGFGWNKVSHIMELEAQGYEFKILPNAFIVHKPHAPSYDITKFRKSPVYRMCLQNLKEEFVSTLQKKYGYEFN